MYVAHNLTLTIAIYGKSKSINAKAFYELNDPTTLPPSTLLYCVVV